MSRTRARDAHAEGANLPAEDGYALLAVLVAVFLLLLTLSVAAPLVSRSLRRDREQEAVHRADQYVRAIRLYYRKFGHYPGSLDQLEKSNNIRFLRQRYTDPFTSKPDWRLIKVGENKTTVKGFFGQPLAGINGTGLGSAASSVSSAGAGVSPTTMSGSTTTAASTSAGTVAAGADGSTGETTVSAGTDASASSGAAGSGSAFGSGSSSGSGGGLGSTGSGISSQPGSSFSGTGAPFMGVGLPSPGTSILAVNEKTTYPEWEFLYDPRIEQLRSKVNLLGGGISATGGSSLGSLSGSTSPLSSSPSSGMSSTNSSTTGSGTTGTGSANTPQQ